MPNIWFTSDTHFGHTNILEFEKEARPFKDVKEMNETLIHNWNSLVRPEDTIFHLGDFAFGKHNVDIAARLQGRKKLILGNHDKYDSAHYLRYFEKLYGMKYWEECLLSHMPAHPNGLGNRWMLNVHGHLHSRRVQVIDTNIHRSYSLEPFDRNYFNVSVEQNNLFPISADTIRDAVKRLR